MSRWARKVPKQLLREIVEQACEEGVSACYVAKQIGYDHSYLLRLAKDLGTRFKPRTATSPELGKLLQRAREHAARGMVNG